MVEFIRSKLKWSSLSRVEQLAFVSSVCIWFGVVLAGGGLFLAVRNRGLEQQAYAQATAIMAEMTQTPEPTATTEVFAMGWATATPTVTPLPTATPTPTVDVPPPLMPDTAGPAPTASVSVLITPTLEADTETEPASAPAKLETQSGPGPASQPPDRIVIPDIDLDSSIVPIGWYIIEQGGQQFSVWQVADYAVSWHKTSAYPGHGGNVVLNGHHNIKGEVFRYLVDLEVGDRILLYTGDLVYYYAVEQRLILKEKGEPAEVRRENAKWIAPTESEQLTMVTCWPYTNNTHRLVIIARPAPAPYARGIEE
jgi:sortase A